MTDFIFDSEMHVELIKSNASDEDVAHAAWVSTKGADVLEITDTDRVKGLIHYLYKDKHMSPFEHGSFTFFVQVPLFVAREFQRHRTWSYNEESGRYSELKPHFYLPDLERPLQQVGKVGHYTFEPGTNEQIAKTQTYLKASAIEEYDRYQRLLDIGVAREVSRNPLPLETYTSFYATANPRNVMQFLDLRTAPNALQEIRDLTEKMEAIFIEQMPITGEVWKRYQDQRHIIAEVLAKHGIDDLDLVQEIYDSLRI